MEELVSQRDHMENQLMMEMNQAKKRVKYSIYKSKDGF